MTIIELIAQLSDLCHNGVPADTRVVIRHEGVCHERSVLSVESPDGTRVVLS